MSWMRKFQNHFLGRLSVILAACKQSILGYVFVDCCPTSSRHCEAKNSSSNSGVASYGATIQVLFCLQDKLMQKSTTHSSFDQYCISHKTIGYRAAAAPGPEVRRECPMTFPALPLLATKLLATPLGSKACWDTVVSCCELSEQSERMNPERMNSLMACDCWLCCQSESGFWQYIIVWLEFWRCHLCAPNHTAQKFGVDLCVALISKRSNMSLPKYRLVIELWTLHIWSSLVHPLSPLCPPSEVWNSAPL